MSLNLLKNEYRTDYCGKINEKYIGQDVTVSGWVSKKRDHGQLLFIDLRDAAGIVQCVFDVDSAPKNVVETAEGLTRESVISISGRVVKRTEETINTKQPTGMIEIQVADCKVLSKANPMPFELNKNVSDELKLMHRYLYLRSDHMQKNLKMRSDVIRYIRNAMEDRGFTEVQTPILTGTSPEGARDYLVPSRLYPGHFYALPQAPQQFKQILMASGVDKYYQIAPCFRDEASRADRSPGEFYQLDFEMSFATQKDVFEVCEPVIKGLFQEYFNGVVSDDAFPVLKYDDCMRDYCSDKPDLRNPLKYQELTDTVKANPPKVFEKIANDKWFACKILPVPGAHELSRKVFDELQTWVQSQGLGGLAYAKKSGGEWSGPGAKMLDNKIFESALKSDGVVFILAGDIHKVNRVGGALRNNLYYEILQKEPLKEARFCWVVDYPMYEWDDEAKQVIFSHNPFSMPQGGMSSLMNDDPLKIKAWQYDLVCNGIELCSGAIRNHEPETLKKAFEIAGYERSEVEEMFGAMISAFEHGVPPHGGAAPGIDRMVMMLCEEHNIREVIAFPLSQNAQDLLMKAPSPITEKQLKDLSLSVIKKNK